jgi:hypothetical protein
LTDTERLKRFLHFPTKAEWDREFEYFGWSGSDGSSSSFDDIEGIRIGKTSRKISDIGYPANLHDWRYQMGRRKVLPAACRKAADKGYRDDCLLSVAILVGFSGWKARVRCHIRYYVLRLVGGFAWTGES